MGLGLSMIYYETDTWCPEQQTKKHHLMKDIRKNNLKLRPITPLDFNLGNSMIIKTIKKRKMKKYNIL